MKMSKQTQEVVKAVNLYLKNNRIKDTGNTVFNVVIYGLLDADCYHGYNYYDDLGRVNPKEFTHIEILTA